MNSAIATRGLGRHGCRTEPPGPVPCPPPPGCPRPRWDCWRNRSGPPCSRRWPRRRNRRRGSRGSRRARSEARNWPDPASPLKRHTSQVVTAVETSANREDDGKRHVAVCSIDEVERAASRPHHGLEPADNGSHGAKQGPDGRHRHRARAHESHIVAPDAADEARQIALHRRHGRDQGHGTGPGDQNAHQHGETDGDSDQMTGAHQRQGK